MMEFQCHLCVLVLQSPVEKFRMYTVVVSNEMQVRMARHLSFNRDNREDAGWGFLFHSPSPYGFDLKKNGLVASSNG